MIKIAVFTVILGIAATQVFASEGGEAAAGHGSFALTFLWISVLLIFAKLSGLVERIGQPSVLGELVIGVVLGNLFLLGFDLFEPIKQDGIIKFLSEFGVVILLFQIGLESQISEMRRVGFRALLVAIIGVVVPFVLGAYVVGPMLLPGLSVNAYLFIGAALTATSVGITARVFKDLGKLQTKEAQIVLGAAVFDDVFGLIILAVISALVTVGAVSMGMVGWIIAKAVLFLIGAVVIGQLAAPRIGKGFSSIQTGIGMKFTLAISFCLLFAFLAGAIGLAPIIGAFAAGLILDPVHFKYFKDPEVVQEIKEVIKESSEEDRKKVLAAIGHHKDKHVEELIEPIAYLLVPLFFVYTGMSVRIDTLFNLDILLVALVLTVVAIGGKFVSGLAAGNVNKTIVGVGMVPRGEVGLIFASIGRGLGVVSDQVFSVIVIMVILTTLVTPPLLAYLLKRNDTKASRMKLDSPHTEPSL